ncbi:MAG: hypothetical protein KAU26_05520 [Methylococcales bacterium]|nr:hypothetical protein [Methylococcales bacterium]
MSKLTAFFLLLFIYQYSAFADIKFTGKNDLEVRTTTETPNSKVSSLKEKQFEEKKEPKKIETTEIERYEIDGYHNSDHVRIIIDVNTKQEISGNMLNDAKGIRTYLYGEYINGVFEMYDAKGEHYRVLMAD